MNIDKMTTREKSVLLAKMMDWRVRRVLINPIASGWGEADPKYNHVIYYIDGGYVRETIDMYEGEMEIAWMVLNWAETQEFWHNHFRTGSEEETIMPFEWAVIRRKPHAEAKRLWLDKVLELAIAAGLVEVEYEI